MTTSGTTDPAPRTLAELADADVRLQLLDQPEGVPALSSTLDGGWWPHTRELALELPLLAAAFAERGVRLTRVVYHPALWLIAPPKLRLDGHVLHLGWLREIDQNLISLRTSQDARVELLVVPPEATEAQAAQAMGAAAQAGGRTSPTDILAAAGVVRT